MPQPHLGVLLLDMGIIDETRNRRGRNSETFFVILRKFVLPCSFLKYGGIIVHHYIELYRLNFAEAILLASKKIFLLSVADGSQNQGFSTTLNTLVKISEFTGI